MSQHDTSPEFERYLQEVAAKYAHMIIPRSEVPPRPITEMRFPEWVEAEEEKEGA